MFLLDWPVHVFDFFHIHNNVVIARADRRGGDDAVLGHLHRHGVQRAAHPVFRPGRRLLGARGPHLYDAHRLPQR